MKDTNDTNRLSDAPCRKCDGCTDPFNCQEFLAWVFGDFRDVAEEIWTEVNANAR